MKVHDELKYTENDEWVKVDGDVATMGITDYAQEQLSDVVFIEILVAEGDEVHAGDSCATVESVKAAADVYLPISGKIVGVNDSLADTPELINSDPYGSAWMVKIEISSPSELDNLMNSDSYQTKIQE